MLLPHLNFFMNRKASILSKKEKGDTAPLSRNQQRKTIDRVHKFSQQISQNFFYLQKRYLLNPNID